MELIILTVKILSARNKKQIHTFSLQISKFSERSLMQSPTINSVFRILLLLALLSCLSGCTTSELLHYSAPSLLPHTEREMKTAGFWISRHPDPDRIILTPQEIVRFNERLEKELAVTRDIFALPSPLPGDEIRSMMKEDLKLFEGRRLYLKSGKRASPSHFNALKTKMNEAAVPDKAVPRYGLIVRYAGQRVLPGDDALYSRPGNIDFDELRNNALDVGTPVAVIHESADGRWLYVIDPMHRGWIKKETAAIAEKIETVRAFRDSAEFVVVTAAKGDLYLREDLTEWHDYARMGSRFPLLDITASGAACVSVPLRDPEGGLMLGEGYMNRSQIHRGYRPYTPRTIIEQAFALLDKPYGWGGMYGEQDCSRFIKELFDTVGIYLPRNSSKQAVAGELIAEYKADCPDDSKLADLRERAVAGITLLRMKGHIMLLLGFANGRPYVIHETRGYKEKAAFGTRVRLINRAAVTDLSLGENAGEGSYLKRVCSIRALR